MASRLLLTILILQVIIQFACPLQFKLVEPVAEEVEETGYNYDDDDEYYYYDDEDEITEADSYQPEVKASVRQVHDKVSDKCPNYSKSSKKNCEKEKNVECYSNDDCYKDELCCSVDCERICIPIKKNKESKKVKVSSSEKSYSEPKSTYSSKNNKNTNGRVKGRKNKKSSRRGYAKVRNDDYDDAHALSGGNYGNQMSYGGQGMSYGGYGGQGMSHGGYGVPGMGQGGFGGPGMGQGGFGGQGMSHGGYGGQGMGSGGYGRPGMGSGGQRNAYGAQGMGLVAQRNGLGAQGMGLGGHRNGYGAQGMNKRNGYGNLGMRQNQGLGNNYGSTNLVGNQSPGFGYGNGMPQSANYDVNQNLASTHPLLDRLSRKLSNTKPGSVYKDPTFQRFHPDFY